jgi:ribosome-binding factor A
MRFHRTERVNKLIREQLSKIIVKELEFPDVLVTLTQVETDKKMEHAKVGVSVVPAFAKATAGERTSAEAKVMRELERKTGWMQLLLFVKINIRPMPMIAFKVDRGYENAAEVERALLKD